MRILIASLLVATVTHVSNAAMTAYEPFNYAAGTLANGTASTAAGFTGNWTVSASPQIVNTVLTYPGLTATNRAYQHAAAGAQTTVGLASSLSSGTKYISYLFKGSGNSGGDTVGVFFKGNNATSLFAGFRVPDTGTTTGFGLGTVNSTTLGGASGLGSAVNINNTATHFIVIKIDFNTSGANDTVSLWIDPPANAAAPGVGANVVASTFDVGTISAFGINITGGYNPIVDELRIGDTYGDVTAYVPPPAAPTGLAATPGVNSVSLGWDATSGATGYKVLRGTSTGVYTVTNTTGVNSFTDNTVIGGTTYFYVVQATNASGAGASSSEVFATPTIALPAVPAGLTAVGTNTAVRLNWSTASGAASYNVKRATTSGAEVTIANVAATSYIDTAVVNGTPYFYKVSSTNGAGESADSSEVTATPNVPPLAPAGVIATAGSNQVALAWTGAAGAASYNIKRSTTSGSGYTTIGTATHPTAAYTDLTAVKFTQYYYVVSAVSAYGESANSTPEATATPTGAYGPTAYEPFNYATGAFANNTPSTATGFAGNWTVPTGATIAAGRTYPNLPTTGNAYQHNASGSQNTVALASPLSSGTKYVSFLIKNSGNSGGDAVGVFLKGNNATSLFAGFRDGYSASETRFGLGTVNSTSLGGASALGSTAVPLNNTATNFIVLKIEFNTAGANETISLWTNPPVNVLTPGVAATLTATTFDVGTISAFGLNILGGYAAVIDEVRIGDVYGDVVGYTEAVPVPTVPTALSLSAAEGKQVSWTAVSTNSYQPQKSANNSTWSNLGGLVVGTAITALYDASPVPYYRVLEVTSGGPGPDVMANGSFENPAGNSSGAANWTASANTTFESVWATNQYGALTPSSGAKMLFMQGTTAASGPAAPNTFILSDPIPVSAGDTYRVKWDAANPVKVGGANPQYRIRFLDAANAFVSETWGSFASAGNTWLTFSNNFVAPANAAKMDLYFIQAIGAGASWDWVTLIDNVSVAGSVAGGTNVLSPAVQLGVAFTAVVKTNGVTATAATGNVKFQTNSAGLSTNALATGSATSGIANGLASPATITAIYSGDGTYIGSTNTLVWTSNSPPVVTSFAMGAQSGVPATVLIIGGKYPPTDADAGDAGNLQLTTVAGAVNGTLSFNATSFTYTPTNNASADSFTYTVGDGRGGYATGTVTVSISSAVGYNLLSASGNVLSYLGIPGANYALENTPSLTPPVVWTAVITNQVEVNGYLRFTNNPPSGFYRTRYVSGP